MATRRRLLRRAAASGLAGLAGCVGGSTSTPTAGQSPGRESPTTDAPPPTTDPETTADPGTTTDSGTTTDHGTTPGTVDRVPVGTERRIDGTTVVVRSVAVRDSVFYRAYPDAPGVRGSSAERFVVATVESGGYDGPARGAFALVAGERRFESAGLQLLDRGAPYAPADGTTTGWVAFRVPAPLDADRVAVAADGVAWRLGERDRERLATPGPEFDLLTVEIPAVVDPGEPFEILVRVANAGDVAGTFRGVLVVTGGGFPAHVTETVALDLAPGERREWRHRPGTGDYGPRPGGEIDVRLRTVAGSRSATVSVREQ